jgi:predicted Zn-dependent peptidase
MRILLTVCAIAAAALASVSARAQEAQSPDAGLADDATSAEGAPLPDTFAGFETWNLDNGMRVWFKRLVGSPTVRIQVALPVGSAQDPPGKEGLAHLVEHLMFYSDREGRDASSHALLRGDGGQPNGVTKGCSTYYYVDLPSSDWSRGVRTVYDLMWGHDLRLGFLEREKKIVLAEGDLKSSFPKKVFEIIFSPGWARHAGFYEREFGFEPHLDGDVGSYESLAHIDELDVLSFFNRYYLPANSVVTIIGDVPDAAARRLVRETFGAFRLERDDVSKKGSDSPRTVNKVLVEMFGVVPRRGPPPSTRVNAVDPGRFRREVDFDDDTALVSYRLRYRLYDVTAEDVVELEFLDRFLGEAIADALRYDLASTYTSHVEIQFFSGHGLFDVGADVLPEKFEDSRLAVDGLIADLHSGRMESARFDELKKRAIYEFLADHRTPQELSKRALDFLDRRQFPDFPDLVKAWRGMTQTDVAGYFSRRLTKDRLVEQITKPTAVSFPLRLLAGILCALLAVGGAQRFFVESAQMSSLRYVAKIRFSIPHLVFLVLFELGVPLFIILLLNIGLDFIVQHMLESWDSDIGRGVVQVLFVGLRFCTFLAIPMFIPRKLLLFEHEWRVKYWLWRSRVYRYEDVREMRELRFWSLLFSRRIFTTCVLHWGLWRKGIYVRTGKRTGWFFRARDNAELMAMLERGKRAWAREDAPSLG